MKKFFKLLLILISVLIVACGDEKNSNVGITSKNYSFLGLPDYYDKIIDSREGTSESYEFTPKEKGIIATTLRSTYKGYDIGRLIYGIDLIEESPHKISIRYDEDNKGFIAFSWNKISIIIPFIIEYNDPKIMQPSSKRDSFQEAMYNDIKKEHGEKAAKEAMKEYYNNKLEPQIYINKKKIDFEYVRDTIEDFLNINEEEPKKKTFNNSDSDNNYKFKGNTLEERDEARIKRLKQLENENSPEAVNEIIAIFLERDEDWKKTENVQIVDNSSSAYEYNKPDKTIYYPKYDKNNNKYNGDFKKDVDEALKRKDENAIIELTKIFKEMNSSYMIFAHYPESNVDIIYEEMSERFNGNYIYEYLFTEDGKLYYSITVHPNRNDLENNKNQIAYFIAEIKIRNEKDGQDLFISYDSEILYRGPRSKTVFQDIDAIDEALGNKYR